MACPPGKLCLTLPPARSLIPARTEGGALEEAGRAGSPDTRRAHRTPPRCRSTGREALHRATGRHWDSCPATPVTQAVPNSPSPRPLSTCERHLQIQSPLPPQSSCTHTQAAPTLGRLQPPAQRASCSAGLWLFPILLFKALLNPSLSSCPNHRAQLLTMLRVEALLPPVGQGVDQAPSTLRP